MDQRRNQQDVDHRRIDRPEDALIDAGYQIRIDTAVEDKRDNRGEIQVPLSSQATSVKGGGQGYIDSFGYSF